MNLSQIKTKAKEDLRGKTVTFIIALVIIMVVGSLTSYLGELNILLSLAAMIITYVFQYGVKCMALKCSRNFPIEIADIFEGFKDVMRVGFTYLLQYIYIFLWSLLLIVPGIIKIYSYALTPYILADYPDLGYNQAIKKSSEMMKGHKGSYFMLYFSFIGWYFLSLFTLGIALIYIYPRIEVASANFYQNLKNQTEGYAPNQNMGYINQNQMNYNQNMGYNNQNQMNQSPNMGYNNQNQMNQSPNMGYNNQNQVSQNTNMNTNYNNQNNNVNNNSQF